MRKKLSRRDTKPNMIKNGFRKKDIVFFNWISKVSIAAVFFVLSLIVIYVGLQPYFIKMQEGDISLSTVYAPFDFTYPGGIDEDKMKKARENAAQAVDPIYSVDYVSLESAIDDISLLFDHLRSAQNIKSGGSIKENIKKIKPSLSLNLSDAAVGILLGEEEIDSLEAALKALLKELHAGYIVAMPEKQRLLKEKTKMVTIVDAKRGGEKQVDINDLRTIDDLKEFNAQIFEIADRDSKKKGAILEVVRSVLKPNLIFAEELTKAKKEGAAHNVPTVRKRLTTKKNEIIIGKGQRVTRQHIVQMSQLSKMQGLSNIASYVVGVALLLAVFILIFSYYLRITEPKLLESPKDLMLVAIIALIGIIIFKLISVSPLPSYIVPFSCATMLAAILVSTNASVILGLLLSVITGIMFGGRLEIVLVCLIGGLAGIYTTRNLRRRFQIIIAGFTVGLANAIIIVSLGLVNNLKPLAYFSDSIWGIANGILSCFIVMGLLPIFEHLFKITTNITLLELSDLNHPLLKDLTLKAPGTYHHSLLVGNLAEAACKSIGANSLLARIGSYYHDIGKIEKAEYFSENESSFKSRHDTLAPSMSSLIIVNHVKEGIELAKKYNLNRPIMDIIQQHHGSGIMYFFYKKALDTSSEEGKLKEDEYRYPGPKPQTKEAAVVLLADSVEASSRSITDPTPGKIRNLVQRIINNKFIDKQLDESDLTLSDLYKIAESFVRVLIAAFHVRTEYPSQREENRLAIKGQDSQS